MKRVTLMLAVLGLLCVAAGRAQGHDFHYAYGPHYGYYAPVVRGPIAVAPRVVVPVRVAPRVVYRPVYGYYPYPYCVPSPYYYGPSPYYGFYYQSGGVSLTVGF